MPESPIVRRLYTVAGSDLQIDFGEDGVPIVAPTSEAAAALIIETASEEGWAVRLVGRGTWTELDPNAVIALAPKQWSDITYLDPGDLVATVQAGMEWSTLRNQLADVGAWLPIDPPGEARSVGSVVATATAGPLRCGFGSIRDHIIGATIVTGDGKIVKPGGQVVKNVAGFDLAKLAAGSFGAFGVITSVTFRLRAIPRSDVTLVATGNRDELLTAGLKLLEKGANTAAMEVFAEDPDDAWTLAIRLVGTDDAVATQRDTVLGGMGFALEEATDPHTLWQDHQVGCLAHPITLRVATPPNGLPAALDLMRHDLVGGWTSVTVFPGSVRWSGKVDADRIKLFRHHAAQHEFPVTVERAPFDVLSEVGHFGAYREGVGRLVGSLRTAFDPSRIFASPVNAS